MCLCRKCHARLGHRLQRGPDPNRLRAADAYRPERLAGPTTINAGTAKLGGLGSSVSISGFGGNGTGWTTNQNSGGFTSTEIANNVLTLSDGAGNEARTRVLRLAHSRRSLYREFCVQGRRHGRWRRLHAAKRQSQCLGWLRRCAGYGTANGGTPITPSAGLAMNIYTGFNGITDIAAGASLASGGNIGSYASTSPVNLASGDPIQVTVSYDGTNNLGVTFSDSTAHTTYNTSYTVGNLEATLAAAAYVGFSGAAGGFSSTQTIANFGLTEGGGAGTASNVLPTATVLSIAKGGTLDLAGVSQQLASLSGSGSVINSNSASARGTNDLERRNDHVFRHHQRFGRCGHQSGDDRPWHAHHQRRQCLQRFDLDWRRRVFRGRRRCAWHCSVVTDAGQSDDQRRHAFGKKLFHPGGRPRHRPGTDRRHAGRPGAIDVVAGPISRMPA